MPGDRGEFVRFVGALGGKPVGPAGNGHDFGADRIGGFFRAGLTEVAQMAQQAGHIAHNSAGFVGNRYGSLHLPGGNEAAGTDADRTQQHDTQPAHELGLYGKLRQPDAFLV